MLSGNIIIAHMHLMTILTQALHLSKHFLADATGLFETMICQKQYFHRAGYLLSTLQKYNKYLE